MAKIELGTKLKLVIRPANTPVSKESDVDLANDESTIFSFVQRLVQNTTAASTGPNGKADMARKMWDSTYVISYEEDKHVEIPFERRFSVRVPPAFTVPKEGEGASLQNVLDLIKTLRSLSCDPGHDEKVLVHCKLRYFEG